MVLWGEPKTRKLGPATQRHEGPRVYVPQHRFDFPRSKVIAWSRSYYILDMARKAQSQKAGGKISDDQQRQIEENVQQEIERKQEAAKAAEKAQYCRKKAKELTDAAKAAGDPDERQKLLNEALNKEVEAETFGKTAKYLQTGAFQGMLAGTGLGAGIGLWLGTVTGTIVGGATGTVTGGIGAGVGLGIGAIHGPFVKIGDLMGNTLRKITGDIPGWKATKEQKATLEKMIYGVQEQEVPGDDEIEMILADGAKVQSKAPKQGETSTSSIPSKSSIPSMPSMPGSESTKPSKSAGQAKPTAAAKKPANASRNRQAQAEDQMDDGEIPQDQRSAVQSKIQPGQAVDSASAQKSSQKPAPSSTSNQVNRAAQKTSVSSPSVEKDRTSSRPPPKQRSSSINTQKPSGTGKTASAAPGGAQETPKKKPRKLEVRSANATGSPKPKRTAQRAGG